MPEGDTIHRAAATLRQALVDEPIVRFDAPRLVGRRPRAGQVVSDVRAVGKHLLIDVTGDGEALTVRTHLGMSGSWHLYRPGERWRKHPAAARVVLEVPGWVAVCFAAPVVEVVQTAALDHHPELVRLGPDLSTADADLDEAARRMGGLAPDTEIGVALLDQRVACGVGNVYKSEVLHACRTDPFTTVGDLGATHRRELIATASRLLRGNLDGYPRRTVPEGLAVYGRAGQPCRRCGAAIRSAKQGVHARVTYWCPECQTPRP